MKMLVNEKLSEHKYKTPEGYLVCTDAILARTGKQTYTRDEIWQDGSSELIEVDRPESEVFSEKTIVSFENKPVTFEHPDVDVNSQNYKDYSVGFVRDVHVGYDNNQKVIMGTLVITDSKVIDMIENGEYTDLSCGYDCDILDNKYPCQSNIRGNHVALCKEGRAGIARIVDSNIRRGKKMTLNDMALSKFEDILKSIGFRITKKESYRKGKKLHYQVETIKNGYTKDDLEKIMDKLDNYECTYSAGLRGNGQIEAGIDVSLISPTEMRDSTIKDAYIMARYNIEYKWAAENMGLKYEEDGTNIRIWGERHQLEKLKNSFDMDYDIQYREIKDSNSRIEKDTFTKDSDSLTNKIKNLAMYITNLSVASKDKNIRYYIEDEVMSIKKLLKQEFDNISKGSHVEANKISMQASIRLKIGEFAKLINAFENKSKNVTDATLSQFLKQQANRLNSWKQLEFNVSDSGEKIIKLIKALNSTKKNYS